MTDLGNRALSEPDTEKDDPRFSRIDLMPVSELVAVMNKADQEVAVAVSGSQEQIAIAIDAISEAYLQGARIIYVGAGTSGRIATLDASEILPTFGVANRFIALMAGGSEALVHPLEGAEDDLAAAELDLKSVGLKSLDVVIGVASSGSTPYVRAALSYATDLGALTAAISCNEGSEISKLADYAIEVVVGPEIVAGSSRLKAGTAQKMVLNMISTITMIRAGKTYKNLMVDMVATNTKLKARAVRMVQKISGVESATAQAALESNSWNTKHAVVSIMLDIEPLAAKKKLEEAGGVLARALGESS